jgi:hypothetical protein
METQSPLPGESGLNTGRLAGHISNTAIFRSQQQRRYKLVHHDAANAATKHLTHDAHLKIVRKTGSGKNMKQDAVGWEYIHIEGNSGQFTV